MKDPGSVAIRSGAAGVGAAGSANTAVVTGAGFIGCAASLAVQNLSVTLGKPRS